MYKPIIMPQRDIKYVVWTMKLFCFPEGKRGSLAEVFQVLLHVYYSFPRKTRAVSATAAVPALCLPRSNVRPIQP